VGTTIVAVIVGGTGVLVFVAVAVSRVVGLGSGTKLGFGALGVAVLVGSKVAVGRTIAGSVAEAVAVGVRDAGVVGVASGLVTVPFSVVLWTVAVICWPAATTSSSPSVVTCVVPVSVSIYV
jgi:hypothetical protein